MPLQKFIPYLICDYLSLVHFSSVNFHYFGLLRIAVTFGLSLNTLIQLIHAEIFVLMYSIQIEMNETLEIKSN